jgi:parvulin-like peptidyl-prolyl cis-trans isomerase-like protein
MFRTGLVCLVLAGFATAQTNSAPVLTPRPSSRVEELQVSGDNSVAPDAPVITVKGLCEKASAGANTADCKTVVTRSDFEKLINAVQPNMPKPQQKQVAARYVQFLMLANKAQDLGLDKGPEFEEQMYLQRLQILARLALEHRQKEAGQVSDAEVESYYRDHSADFRTISYDKIYVPKQKQADAPKREADEAAMKAEADKLRASAAAGEDFVKLQQEAYDAAGLKLKSTSANTHVEKVRKNALPPSDGSIFELKKGEVSQVFNDPAAYMIYKVDDFQDQPLSDVKQEVARSLQGQKLKTFSEELQKSVAENTTYNDSYFAVPAAPSLKNPGEPPAAPSGAQASPAPGKK